MKVTFVVEADLNKHEIVDVHTIREDLLHDWVKVKSGPYENLLMGTITDITLPTKIEEVQRA